MKKHVFAGLMACLVATPSLPALAADTMKPGLWEITTTMEMPGMPFQPPPQTVRHCYTPEDIKEQPVPTDEQCKVTDLQTVGNKVRWKVECRGEASGKGDGEITYLGDSAYEGKSRMQTQGMTMSTRYKARRLGNCK